jgi:hypothetical protein
MRYRKNEISRVKSPDNRLDAVMIRTNGGATTPYGYFLYIVPSGTEIKNKE